MILVVAAAISSVWFRELFGTTRYRSWSSPFRKWADLTILWLPCVLVPVTFAALFIRLRQPRPSLRRTLRQPGAIATTLSALSAIYLGAMILLRFAVVGPDAFSKAPCPNIDLDLLGGYFLRNGLLVGATWAALGLSGRFRPERGWIDGFGRLVGAAWVAFWAANELGHWLNW